MSMDFYVLDIYEIVVQIVLCLFLWCIRSDVFNLDIGVVIEYNGFRVWWFVLFVFVIGKWVCLEIFVFVVLFVYGFVVCNCNIISMIVYDDV